MTGSRDTIVVMVHHGLGDVVMALPMLHDIDRNMPADWHLCLAIKGPLEASLIDCIAWRHPVSTLQIGAERGPAAALRHVPIPWRMRHMAPAVFVAAQMLPRATNAVFARIVGAPVSVGPEGPWQSAGFGHCISGLGREHKTIYFAKFAEAAGLRDKDAPLTYPPLKVPFPAPGENTAPTFLFAPACWERERYKRWPLEKFARLSALLSERKPGSKILLFGSAGERPLLSELSGLIGDRADTEIVVPGTVGDSLATLARADCVIGACTGTLHLAALAGRPIVGLYGPTNPSITGPYSDRLTILRLGLACSPCFAADFLLGCGTPICMQDIGTGPALDAVLEALEGRFKPAPKNVRTSVLRKPVPLSPDAQANGESREEKS